MLLPPPLLSLTRFFFLLSSFSFQCFTSVHYGGKRSKHKFRSLFDFYNKRVDYGDGEFPSKWPQEIIQDEYSGWFVREAEDGSLNYARVTPRPEDRGDHAAAASGGANDWVKYFDAELGRHFYHNTDTNVSSFDRPVGFLTPRLADTAEEKVPAIKGYDAVDM